MPTIKSKFPCYIDCWINGKARYDFRGDRVAQNVEWIHPVLTGKLILRTQTQPDININHKTQNRLAPCI